MNRYPIRAAALVVVVAVASCGDAPTEPGALLVAEHARAALNVSVPLPSLAGAETLTAAEFGVVLGDLGIWLDAAEARLEKEADARADLSPLRAEVANGRALLLEAERLEANGDRGAAVAALVAAEAHLLRTTAYAVAERRIAAASAAAARCPSAASAGPDDADVSIRRGRRLLDHAREALAEEDFERAVQRAHYAEALLATACPSRIGVER